jgi:myo-inositol 2-dehydrogenase/D-chiro-inositol 1-dehydrogenase
MAATSSSRTHRRQFLQTSAAAATTLALAPAVHAAGSDVLRIGLIGCGGRGTGAAADALRADPHVRLVALGDTFRDRLEASLAALQRDPVLAAKIDVPPERRFVGFQAYQQVIEAGVDVVLLATPPHFRPLHLRAAVQANKHVFAEKPVAVDAPGVRSVLASCEEARRRRLSIVSGLCWRYDRGVRETIQRIQEGALGEIVALQCVYNTHTPWVRRRQPGWSDMEWQVRNWPFFTWLSGDFIVEQHVHSLDKMAWVLGDRYPLRAWATGGRQQRTGPEYGNIYDHFAVVYEYANGLKCFSYCRQQENCAGEVKDYVFGSRGRGDILDRVLTGLDGRLLWRYPRNQARQDVSMYQAEHNALFASIRSGTPINNGEYMAKSTLMAILGRMAAYTGQVVTWEQALNSTQDLSPPRYEWGPLPVAPVAIPGVTRLS